MIWATPNGAAFVGRIHQDLSDGKNVVCVLPQPQLDEDFTPTLDEHFYNNSQGRLIRLDATYHPDAIDLVSLFKLGWNWMEEGLEADDLVNSLENMWHYFANDHDLRFVVLTGLDRLSEEDQVKISGNVAAWARFSQQSRTNSQKPAGLRFLILVSPNFPTFVSDLFLTVHHWWAQTDIVDHQWAFQRLLIDNPPSNLAMDWWLQAVCRALGYYDWTMLKLIIDDPPLNFEQIKARIRHHPLFAIGQTGKHRHAHTGRFLKPLSLKPPRPPDRNPERSMWADGLFSHSPHHFPHPVLMTDDQLEYCLSFGQRQVFLPLVDHVLSMLRQTIEVLFGEGVWDFYEPDESQRSSIAAEISPLAFFVKKTLPHQKWSNLNERKALVDMAFAWRTVRHTIAHNRMLDFSNFEIACDRYNACYCI